MSLQTGHEYNISPIDGRYYKMLEKVRDIFSDKELTRTKLNIENEYLGFILNILHLDRFKRELRTVLQLDENKFYKDIKEIEATTNHDIKAIEYFLQNYYKEKGHKDYIPYIHIGLTSEDINCLCRSIVLQKGAYLIRDEIKILNDTIFKLLEDDNWNVIMLARTHGQPATPVKLSKEFKVYMERLSQQLITFNDVAKTTKFGGATGGFNALKFSRPNIDWNNKLDIFVKRFNLARNNNTTQIDHYDNYSEVFDLLKRISIILVDMCQDIWLYISMDYFKLATIKNEVGSSTMPHKVNPIDFENAEGNLKLAISLFNFFSEKLPISRLQRDLTDSTVSRNFGVAFSHLYIAIQNIKKGLAKLRPNIKKISDDLNSNWAILGEAVQTVLRLNGIENAYEILKDFTRETQYITREQYIDFVNGLNNITQLDKNKLLELTPEIYGEMYI